MCKWLMEKEDGHKNWSRHIWFTDEPHFHLNGHVNAHNGVYWSERKPEEVTETGRMGAAWSPSTPDTDFSVHTGFKMRTETRSQSTRSVTDTSWVGFMKTWQGTMTGTQVRLALFMQDGAPPHTARDPLQLLQKLFGHRVIS